MVFQHVISLGLVQYPQGIDDLSESQALSSRNVRCCQNFFAWLYGVVGWCLPDSFLGYHRNKKLVHNWNEKENLRIKSMKYIYYKFLDLQRNKINHGTSRLSKLQRVRASLAQWKVHMEVLCFPGSLLPEHLGVGSIRCWVPVLHRKAVVTHMP